MESSDLPPFNSRVLCHGPSGRQGGRFPELSKIKRVIWKSPRMASCQGSPSGMVSPFTFAENTRPCQMVSEGSDVGTSSISLPPKHKPGGGVCPPSTGGGALRAELEGSEGCRAPARLL